MKIREHSFVPDNLPEPGAGFPLVPKGDYIAEVEQIEERPSRAGNLMWNITFQILTDETGNEIEGVSGRPIFGFVMAPTPDEKEFQVSYRYFAMKAFGFQDYGPDFESELDPRAAERDEAGNKRRVLIRVIQKKSKREGHEGELENAITAIKACPDGVSAPGDNIPF